jgi:hypothetical protein
MLIQPKRQNKGRAATEQAKQWLDASESSKNPEIPRIAPFGARMTNGSSVGASA